MKEITVRPGLIIHLPDDVSLPAQISPIIGSKRRGKAVTVTVEPVQPDPVVAALQEQDLVLHDGLPVVLPVVPPEPPGPRLRRAVVAPAPQAGVTVDLAEGEQAILLTECNGFYEWHPPQPVAETQTLRTAPLPGVAKFTVSLAPRSTAAPVSDTPARRNVISDVIIDATVGILKAYVFKFAANAMAIALTKFLERKVQRGLVKITSARPEDWQRAEDFSELKLPTDRRARVLLFIHGTFSSTVGSYGALGATPWGQSFLQGALASYDAVVGFDHATLGEDPRDNANDLWRRLKADTFALPPVIDVVAYSRGGLVFRYLAEEILPRMAPAPKVDRAVFIGCTLNGTELANPQNWERMLGLYTNLAAGTARVLGKLPSASAQTVSAVLGGSIQTLGAFAKVLAVTALTDRKIPGLAAMEPDGEFIKSLDQAQPGEPTPQTSWYAAVTSEFQPQALLALVDKGQVSELPRELLLRLADGAAAQIIVQANDLVVNTASMTTLDPHHPDMFKDKLEYGVNPQVYHLNYFLQPATANALVRWLRLVPPTPAPLQTVRRTRRRGPAFSPAAFARGLQPLSELPVEVDTDVLDLPLGTTIGEAETLVRETIPSYVVLRRLHYNEILHYALPAEEVLLASEASATQGKAPTEKLVDFLQLHETDSSEKATVGGPLIPRVVGSEHSPTTARTVFFEGDRAVGVLPEQQAPLSVDELITRSALTISVQTRQTVGDKERILYRRMVPSFMRASAKRGIGTTVIISGPQFAEPITTPDPTKFIVKHGSDKQAHEILAPPTLRGERAKARGQIQTQQPAQQQARQELSQLVQVPSGTSPPNIDCHFRAETNEQCSLEKETSLLVTITREKIEEALQRGGAEGVASVDPTRKITLQFVAKRNVQATSGTETELDVDPPEPDAPVLRRFRFVPVQLGAGEIWILAWQRQQPLVTLPVKFEIVPKDTPPSLRQAVKEAACAEASTGQKAVDRLTIIEEITGGQIVYRYEFQSPTIGRNWLLRSEALKQDRTAFVDKLYRGIEALWPGAAGLTPEERLKLFEQDLQAYGATLLDQLVPKELQQVLWDNRERLGSIHVFSEEPFIPWEILHLRPPDKAVADGRTWFLGELGLVRWLHNKMLPPEKLIVRKTRSFYVIPSYADSRYDLPEAQKEKPFIIKEFSARECPSNSVAVRQLLRGPAAVDLFHFAGHGEADQAAIDDSYIIIGAVPDPSAPAGKAKLDMLHARLVGTLAQLTDGAQIRPVVILNACRAGRVGWSLTKLGGFADAFLTCGAGLFVGAHWSVGDMAARHFTEAFYKELKAGATVAQATVKARNVARAEHLDPTWLAYTVYGHPHATLELKP